MALLQLELIDFGATREYTQGFIDKYRLLLHAAIQEDSPSALAFSQDLGYLTGEENEVWLVPGGRGDER
jgi:aarF domain-containing kinase